MPKEFDEWVEEMKSIYNAWTPYWDWGANKWLFKPSNETNPGQPQKSGFIVKRGPKSLYRQSRFCWVESQSDSCLEQVVAIGDIIRLWDFIGHPDLEEHLLLNDLQPRSLLEHNRWELGSRVPESGPPYGGTNAYGNFVPCKIGSGNSGLKFCWVPDAQIPGFPIACSCYKPRRKYVSTADFTYNPSLSTGKNYNLGGDHIFHTWLEGMKALYNDWFP